MSIRDESVATIACLRVIPTVHFEYARQEA